MNANRLHTAQMQQRPNGLGRGHRLGVIYRVKLCKS